MRSRLPLAVVQHVQDADRFSSPAPERHRDHVVGDEAGRSIDLAKVAGVSVDLVRDPGLSRLKDGAGNTFIPGNAGAPGDRLVADRILKDQFLLLRVCEQNEASLCSHLFQRNMEGRFEELVEINRLKQGVADALECFELRLIVEKF